MAVAKGGREDRGNVRVPLIDRGPDPYYLLLFLGQVLADVGIVGSVLSSKKMEHVWVRTRDPCFESIRHLPKGYESFLRQMAFEMCISTTEGSKIFRNSTREGGFRLAGPSAACSRL